MTLHQSSKPSECQGTASYVITLSGLEKIAGSLAIMWCIYNAIKLVLM